MNVKTVKAAGDKDEYMDLVRRFPLRPIRSMTDYEQAGDLLIELLDREAGHRLSSAESDYVEMLGRLVGDYDEKHSSLLKNRQRMTPVEALKALMEETGMNSNALGKLVGGSGLASLILNGKRELSKANIRKLAAHFHVSPALFI